MILTTPPVSTDPNTVLSFLDAQMPTCGGDLEIAPGAWALFAVEQSDSLAKSVVESLLIDAPFAHDSGESEDDGHVLYYVDDANRAAAVHWLSDRHKFYAGEIRPVSLEQRHLIDDVVGSETPHRAARELTKLHDNGTVTAGLIHQADTVRALLDRLHGREPLFYGALLMLLDHHLVDMLTLFRRLIGEDLALLNEIVKGGLSRDPFLQSRQDATSEIRNRLIAFRIINPMDQLKNTGIKNPYAAYLEIATGPEGIIAPIDGIKVTLNRTHFLNAIHSIRRQLYQGQPFETFDTQSPWMNDTIALPFRFIRQRLASRSDLSPLDALYMLERAVAE